MKPGLHFVDGGTACAEGAIFAGCRFFAGYPITPATSIVEWMATRLPQVKGYYLQMEDEIASMAAIIGASWAGGKAMTATSGPGFSLMQENLGYAYLTETPLVVVDAQRSGPSTGQATMPGQQDIMQARFGTHGDVAPIAFSPWSVQEMFDFTIHAFNYAERFRTPTLVMTDGEISYMREPINIPKKSAFPIINRQNLTKKSPRPKEIFLRYEMPRIGDGHNLLITGSAHRPDGIRDYTPQYHRSTVEWIFEKNKAAGRALQEEHLDLETYYLEDATEAVISFGAAARPALQAVNISRQQGRAVGFIRLKTLWPLPETHLGELLRNVHRILVVEMNMGMMVREIARISCHAKIESVPKIAGEVHHSQEIVNQILEDDAK
ncbi:MAG: 2-oxoacid:acceptor oxidoreductase subunit alpha [Candidatus Thorarchaeota archaeon]